MVMAQTDRVGTERLFTLPIQPLIGGALEAIEQRLDGVDGIPPCLLADAAEQYSVDMRELEIPDIFRYVAFPVLADNRYPVSRLAVLHSTSNFAARECRTLYLCRALGGIDFATHLLAHVTGMDVHRFAQGMITDNDSDRLTESALPLRDSEFSIAHVQFVTISQICKWMELSSKESDRSPYVVIDDSRLLTEFSADACTGFESTYERLTAVASDYNATIGLVEYHVRQ
jgi:hypothetical protein